jgi:hypothetical protein
MTDRIGLITEGLSTIRKWEGTEGVYELDVSLTCRVLVEGLDDSYSQRDVAEDLIAEIEKGELDLSEVVDAEVLRVRKA